MKATLQGKVTLMCAICMWTSIESEAKTFSGRGETPSFWREKAKHDFNEVLSKVGRTLGKADNVILFLGDGMGVATVTTARILKGQMNGNPGEETVLNMEKFPHVALSKTYNQDRQTADSSAAATAFLSGVKANQGTLGVDASVPRTDCEASKQAHVTSILDWSLAEGKSVGIVTNTRVTHATPAAAYANSADRDWENDRQALEGGDCRDITRQLIEDYHAIQVIMGGGRKNFLKYDQYDPEAGLNEAAGRHDGRDLIKEWIDLHDGMNARYVWNLTDFYSVEPRETDYLLGLFNHDHMQYEADRTNSSWEQAGEPSLTEMTEKAIQILRKNPKGYFLLVEGGRIDHAHHDTNAHKALLDTIAFDDAIERADYMTSSSDTLIVVTADHSHVMTMGGYSSRGNPILGKTDNETVPGIDSLDAKQLPYTTLMYANGQFDHYQNGKRENISNIDTTGNISYVQQSMVQLSSETHGGEDVAIYARGPMSYLFQGVYEQSYIPHVMAYASCVGDYKQESDCAAGYMKKQAQARVRTDSTSNAAAIRLNMYIFAVLCFWLW